MNRRYAPVMTLAFVGLVGSILACNAPTPTPEAPTSTLMPDASATSPPQETLPPTPTQWFPPTHTPISVQPAVTETPSTPTATPSPTITPTPTPPISTGPLDFVRPDQLDSWQPLPDGKYECTIVLQIRGGALPYTVHHDLDVFTTQQTRPPLVFTAHGCGAIVHTIKVESADGQSAMYDYWIPAPWCEE
jgi:hypothetical protein